MAIAGSNEPCRIHLPASFGRPAIRKERLPAKFSRTAWRPHTSLDLARIDDLEGDRVFQIPAGGRLDRSHRVRPDEPDRGGQGCGIERGVFGLGSGYGNDSAVHQTHSCGDQAD